MDLEISKEELLKGLYLAQGIASKKGSSPILANVLIKTVGTDKVVVAATDLHTTVTTEISAKVKVEGGITLAARQFFEIVKNLPQKAQIGLSRNAQNWAEIQAGKAQYKIVGETEREYPELPDLGDAELQDVDPAALMDMIGKTVFSISTDDTRQHLAGGFLECDGDNGTMVSTDGHRLSKVVRQLPGGPKLDKGVLIPRKGVFELRRVLESAADKVQFGIKDKYLVAKSGSVTLSVKLSESQFPPYAQVIPTENSKVVQVGRDVLAEALRRMMIMASDKNWGVRFSLAPDELAIEADNPELGNAKEVLSVSFTGDAFAAGFNGKYFLDVLGEMGAGDVRLEFSGELDPAVIRAADGSDYLGVVMPMRL